MATVAALVALVGDRHTLALLLAGSVASGVIGLQRVLPRGRARRTRELSLWLHILLLWPLPALLGFHILKTYWY